MANFKFYEAQTEPSSPAYEMLLRAELAKADQMAHFFDPTQRALETNRRASQVDRELAAREKAQAQEAKYQSGTLALQNREQTFRESEAKRRNDSSTALQGAVARLVGGNSSAPPPAPVDRSTSFPQTGAAVTRSPQSFGAGSVLHPDHLDPSVPDPEDIAHMLPEDQAQYRAWWKEIYNADRQMAAQKQKEATAQEARANVEKFLSVDQTQKNQPIFSEADKARYRAMDPETAAKESGAQYQSTVKLQAARESAALAGKELRKAIKPEDPERDQKIASIIDFEKYANVEQDPEKINTELKARQAYVHGYDEKARTEAGKPKPGVDLAGIVSNYTFNTALGKPGEYEVRNGKPVLPRDVDAEATQLAIKANADNPLFNNRLMGYGELTGTAQQAIKIGQDAVIDATKQRILDMQGWKPSAMSNAKGEMGQAAPPKDLPFETQTTPPGESLLQGLPDEVKSAAFAARSQGAQAVAKVLDEYRRSTRLDAKNKAALKPITLTPEQQATVGKQDERARILELRRSYAEKLKNEGLSGAALKKEMDAFDEGQIASHKDLAEALKKDFRAYQ